MSNNIEELKNIIAQGDIRRVKDVTKDILSSGISYNEIVNQAIMPGLEIVGRGYEKQDLFISDMLISARTAKMACELFEELQPENIQQDKPVFVIGTVEGDLHDIGKNLVSMALKAAGFEIVDLGVDVSPDNFVIAAESDPRVVMVGASALLSTTLPALEKTVSALRHSKVGKDIIIFVGGAPVTAAYAKKIRADIYTESAIDAATAAKLLWDERSEKGILPHRDSRRTPKRKSK